MSNIAKEGDWVILRINDGAKYVAVQVTSAEKVRVSKKQTFSATKLVGCKLGIFYELKKGNSLQIYIPPTLNTEIPEDLQNIGDNREIPLDSKAQALTVEEIEEMKKNEDITAQEMIEKIKENNKSFVKKTIFAQEKYLKKKEKKHVTFMKLLYPNSRTIAEAFYTRAPPKIFFMRPDSLASILSYANIYAGRKVIIQENCSGLLAGTIVEKMGGYGDILNLYTEQQLPVFTAFRPFNFSEQISKSIIHFPYQKFKHLMDIPLEKVQSLSTQNDNNNDDNNNNGGDVREEVLPFKVKNSTDEIVRIRAAFEGYADSLVIASHHNPALILNDLFPFLAPSGHVVIFHPQLQPLVECHEMLKQSEEVLLLDIHEIWFRDYQVLPKRTHPFMRMNASGGYILSAIKVVSEEYTSPDPPLKKVKLTE